MVRLLPLSLLLSGLLLAACAKAPGSVAPIPMPNGMFAQMSCEQTRAEHVAGTAALNTLERQQRNAATGDAISVFMLGLPASSLFGGDKSGDLGVAKGKMLALDARLATC